MRRSVISLSVAVIALTAVAHAEPRLIAAAALDAHGHDLSVETAAPLENGVPGNLLGGMGSAFDYAGGDTFIAMPDRGPNANKYNPSVDDTSSYIPRFHTLVAKLVPSSGALPFTLEPKLVATTLLWSPEPLVYGDGKVANLADGAPKLNGAGNSTLPAARTDSIPISALPIRWTPVSIPRACVCRPMAKAFSFRMNMARTFISSTAPRAAACGRSPCPTISMPLF